MPTITSNTSSPALNTAPLPLSPEPEPPKPFPSPKTPNRRCYSGTKSSFSTPDRFIPKRSPYSDSASNLRTSKPIHKLSSDEKLHRKRNSHADPFNTKSSRYKDIHQVLFTTGRHPRRPSGYHFPSFTSVTAPRANDIAFTGRKISAGSIWNVGGSNAAVHGPYLGVSDGRGGYIGSGTNAPMLVSRFFDIETKEDDLLRHEARLAFACEIDQASRILQTTCTQLNTKKTPKNAYKSDLPVWNNGWTKDSLHAIKPTDPGKKPIPLNPFKVLDAPCLRDDYYCSVLAYSPTAHCLAVALGPKVYKWSESDGVKNASRMILQAETYVTSLSFSCKELGKDILAVGRQNGNVSLYTDRDVHKHFELQHDSPVACVSFKPVPTRRLSSNLLSILPYAQGLMGMDDLLVGTESGDVYYYSVEWPSDTYTKNTGWTGAVKCLVQISAHCQQICGLAWSPDGEYFASGGNDNACCLFEVASILPKEPPPSLVRLDPKEARCVSIDTETLKKVRMARLRRSRTSTATANTILNEAAQSNRRQHAHTSLHLQEDGIVMIRHQKNLRSFEDPDTNHLRAGCEKQYWPHRAAVKAIAFCPWQRGLLATGGGSNDRCIHFWHTFSGASLATIHVAAQVTSLVWSTTRREIAATFGYAQPEHPYRIAVFSWPECRQVVAIPWSGEHRALHAIAYPGGPDDGGSQRGQGTAWWRRTREEGCIVVASSEESVKFHEVWSDLRKGKGKATNGQQGILGGSDILEALEGVEKDWAEVVR
ncbi:MAG: hypothetical protein M1834_002883 [Cirrosporium novae-zelandiae]|nr:MAG: hypothetical protein M1834_002883 [Cirrosporium novae-zelandiae]